MKKYIVFILLFISCASYSQFIAPNNIPVAGYDTTGGIIGRMGKIYVLKPTNVQSPLTLVNDSTIGITGAALTKTDDANVTLTLGGTPTTALLNATSLTLGWTGVLPISRGGTNNGSLSVTNGTIYYGDGSKLIGLAPGNNGQHLVLKSGLPFWGDTTAVSGSSGWALTGNAGTTAGTNFLGTTDDINLMFKRNNVQAGLIDSSATTAGKTFFGYGAGLLNTANNSTAIGFKALNANTSNLNNTVVGSRGLLVTTGAGNTAMGAGVMVANTTGASNTAMGVDALSTNISGGSNVAIGNDALKNNTTSQNTAVGHSSQLNTSTGINNTSLGYFSLKANTTNAYSTAIGWSALVSATGARNTAVGGEAMTGMIGGANNTAIGEAAGYTWTTGSYNVRVGAEYLRTNGVTTGSANTLIGANIGGLASSLSNTIVIADGDGNQRIYTNSSGQTGLKYTSPSATLQLAPGEAAAGKAPLIITYISLATTAASSAAGTATITFAAQAQPPFMVGSSIVVAGVTPAGFNGTQVVTACTTTSVSFTNATAGPQTVAGTVVAGVLLTTPVSGAVESDGTHLYWTDATGTRKQLD